LDCERLKTFSKDRLADAPQAGQDEIFKNGLLLQETQEFCFFGLATR
jgi:hypothetical protein